MFQSRRQTTSLWRWVGACLTHPQQKRGYDRQWKLSNQDDGSYKYIQRRHEHHKAGFRARAALAEEWLRTYGFWLAPVNPLRRDGLMTTDHKELERALPPTLRPLVEPFLEARVKGGLLDCLPPSLVGTDEEPVLRTLLEQYCSGIGYEVMHCTSHDERQFFIQAAGEETVASSNNQDQDLIWCWEQVYRAGEWERLLSKRFPTCRRFSLEGLESGALAINTIFDTFAMDDRNDTTFPRVVLGTLHRGRINLIHTVLQRSSSSLFRDWDLTDGPTYDDITLGRSANIVTRSGRNLHVSLVATPAHLESQDAAVNGKAYGHMVSSFLQSPKTVQPNWSLDGSTKRSVLPVMVHGDSSFCGQGIVSETLQLSTFADFDCGGTIHVIFNNQVGFTAESQKMRTSRHLVNVSDVALSIRAPVLHVNAERPWDVFRAARLATLYRQKFGKDIVLDLWGYRKHGHNEVDEPRITNVSLYQEVDAHKPVADVFAATLPDNLRKECQELQKQIEAEYREAAALNRERRPDNDLNSDATEGEWVDFLTHPSSVDGVTGVGLQDLKAAISMFCKVPEGFTLAPATQRIVSRRADLLETLNEECVDSSPPIDWATAELLALSTLALEGHFCRLSGQDSQRGTFTQRHAVWHDAATGQSHFTLPPLVQVVDSPLSELGVLGFEHGVSLASPNFLVLWEAQFADFVNNSQVLIDTMISSEKEKFGLESNLVLLLPHGYDGMGPEHSSSRLERFLSLHTDTPEAAENTQDDVKRFRTANFTALYPSSPSNYFHALRRSFSWPFRRPMVVLTPKRTLRLARAASPVSEFLRAGGTQATFLPVLDDPRGLDPEKVKSIVICSGEIFYDILKFLEALPQPVSETVAIIRLEQLAPFPLRQLKTMREEYPFARRAVWIQEEPRNMGALGFVAPFLERVDIQLSAPISRPVSAAPASGNPPDHQASQLGLMSRISEWIEQGSSMP